LALGVHYSGHERHGSARLAEAPKQNPSRAK